MQPQKRGRLTATAMEWATLAALPNKEGCMRLLPLVFLLLVGCAGSTHVLVGEKRPPISPDLVKVYRSPPPKFEEVAIIEGNSNNSLAITEQGQVDDVIQEMKKASAKLGANGVVVETIYYDAMLGRIGRGTAIFVISE